MSNQPTTPELRFPQFSGDWKMCVLGEETLFFNNKRIPIKSNERIRGIYPYYGATGIIDYVNDYIFDGEYLLLGEDGANIITRSAPLVYKVKGKFWVNNHAHVFQPKEDNDINFLHQVLERVNYIPYNTGTAQPKLNMDSVFSVKLILPQKEEQTKIGEFFALLDQRIEKQQDKIAELETYKKGLMQKIFSQELRFKNDDGSAFSEWKQINLEKVSDVLSGKRVPKGMSLTELDTGIPYISVSDMGEKYVDQSNIQFITKEIESYIKKYKVNTGDIIISVAGTLGEINLIDESLDSANLTENCDKITNFKEINNKYLFYYMKSKHIQRLIAIEQTVSSQPKLALTRIRKFPVLVPYEKEQTKIANFLSALDKKIDTEKSRLMAFQDQKKGLMQRMFV